MKNNNTKNACASICSVGACLTSFGCANAAVIFDSYDAAGTFHATDNLVAASVYEDFMTNTVRLAVQFRVNCSDFALDSITLPISVQKNVADNVLRVRLAQDAGGAPGATVEVLSLNQGIWPAFTNPFTNQTTLLSAAHPILSEGSDYWIVTEPTAFRRDSTHT